MKNIFKDYSETIWTISAKKSIIDPYEKNADYTKLRPIPIKAIVTDLLFSQVAWKIPGITTAKVKEIIIEKKRKNLLLQSYRIRIQGEDYQGWKVAGKLQFRQEGDYIRAYVYIEQENTNEI